MDRDLGQEAQDLVARIRDLSPQSVSRPTLVYFDIIGICWPIRCLLHLQDVAYERIPVPIELWGYTDSNGVRPVKAAFGNAHVPLYVDPDMASSQSLSILQYLAEKHGMMGDTPQEKFAILDVMAHAYDALFHWTGMLQVVIKMNVQADVVEARRKAFLGEGAWGLVTGGYHNNLRGFEHYLDTNPKKESGFIVGDRLSVADLHAYNILYNWYKAFDRKRFAENFPRLDAYGRRIASVPGVADYVARHQEATTWFPAPHLATRLTAPEDIANLTA